MPPGETLGNGAQFIPMPGFDHGMMGPGPMMGPSPEEIKRQQEEMRRQQILQEATMQRNAVVGAPLNYNRPRPVTLDIDATESGVDVLGGTANISIDKSQQLRLGGRYMPSYNEQGVPVPQTYRVEGSYNTPSFEVNLNYRPRSPMGGGLGGAMYFNRRF